MSSGCTSKPSKKVDPGWEHGFLLDEKDKNKVQCKHCNGIYRGGITRLKKHLAGIQGDAAPCKQVPQNVRDEMIALFEAKKKKDADKADALKQIRDEVRVRLEDSDEDIAIAGEGSSKGSATMSKRSLTKGPMDKFYALSPEEARRKEKQLQTTLNEKFKGKEREKAVEYIAGWFYEAGIAFNTVRLQSFDLMLEAIGQYGRGLKKPSPHELSEPLLKKHVARVKDSLQSHKQSWISNGCSLMTDAWTDRTGRSLMNLMVHCILGTSFYRSIDASADVHDGPFIFRLVDECIEEIGQENVVQVVSDNASNNMAAANLLSVKRPNIFWTPCAAHCIDLMLEDIGKIPKVKNVITSARSITVFIYGHTITLSIMRKFTGKRNLVRAGVTRFATSFLNLQSLDGKKKELKAMFTSKDWDDCKCSKKPMGKKIYSLVVSNKFWSDVSLVLKFFEPLVEVLRRVDSDIPAMGYLYGDLEHAKREVALLLNEDEKKYLPIWNIIDKRWDAKLKGPLHLAGYYLNPYFYYEKKDEIEKAGIFMDGVITCMLKIYPNDQATQDFIIDELKIYRNAMGSFGREIAKRQRQKKNLNPAEWWSVHGTDARYLRIMAMRILSLTCSSSGCERNWSSFEMVHSKKRTRLDQKKMNDLVYVMFNKRLQAKQENKPRDPIALTSPYDITSNEWLIGVSDNEDDTQPEGIGQEPLDEGSNINQRKKI